MSIFSSYKKIFLLGFMAVILVAIPFSVYIAQKKQNISSKATPSTTLSLEPALTTAKVGETVVLNIKLKPGTNLVSFVKFAVKFDPTKFATISGSLVPNTVGNALKEPIDDPQYDIVATEEKASISLFIGANPADAIAKDTNIAILKLKALSTTSTGNPSTISFIDSDIQILSVDTPDMTSENVFSSSNPATITITSASTVTAPTSAPTTPTAVPTGSASLPTSAPAPGSGGSGGSGSGGRLTSPSIAPVCSGLQINGLTSGTAPYPLTFIATGSDSDGTISKISFNFGDSIEDLTVGGGIGTSTVSGQISHTYTTPGIYTAYAILTDNNGNLSAQQSSCTQTVTINSTGESTPTTVIQQPLPPTGDGKIIFGLGTLGVIFTIIGGALLLL